jgi:hypothetical protein
MWERSEVESDLVGFLWRSVMFRVTDATLLFCDFPDDEDGYRRVLVEVQNGGFHYLVFRGDGSALHHYNGSDVFEIVHEANDPVLRGWFYGG